jgi:hypothetical protein
LTRRKALLAAILLAGALVAAALLLSFDSPALARDVAERFRSASGIDLEFSRARFGLLRGLVLEDARASLRSYDLRVSRMVIEHRPLALLRGGFEVRGIELDDARAGRASIEKLRLTLSRLSYDPRALTALHGIDTEGIFRMSRAAFGAWDVRGVAARLTAEGGRVGFEDLTFATKHGNLSGAIAFDFNSLPFRYRLTLSGSSLRLEGIGQGDLSLEGAGFGTKARDLRGRGTFEIGRGTLPDAPWVRSIDPSLAGAEHGPLKVPFEIVEERIRIEPVEMEAAGRVLRIEGSLGFDGSQDLRGR